MSDTFYERQAINAEIAHRINALPDSDLISLHEECFPYSTGFEQAARVRAALIRRLCVEAWEDRRAGARP